MWRICLIGLLAAGVMFAAPSAPPVPAAALPSPHFDAKVATDAWLATMPPAARAKSNAYFEGGYWLILWDFLFAVGTALLLLETRWSARFRDAAESITRIRFLQSVIYWAEFSFAIALLTSPLTIFEGFIREHQYGLSNQNFASWSGDQIKGLVLGMVLGGPAFAIVVAIVRKVPRTWHLWGAAAGIAFVAISLVIFPVVIAPVFNTYTLLQDARMKNQILSMARANGIAANDVYQVNASRQSKRVSANVSGLWGTERITLNDNLLNRCSPEAVMAVMGHEMGHYVLHHIYTSLLFSGIIIAFMFAVLRAGLKLGIATCSARWAVRDTGDLAVLPLAVLILAALSFLLTPLTNTWTRTQEYEADIFGLNASRQPDGEAEADMLLGEYRKLDPSPLEEFIFFDHPSGRTRVYAAMRWKRENLSLFSPASKPESARSASTKP